MKPNICGHSRLSVGLLSGVLTTRPPGFEGLDGVGLIHSFHRRPVLEVDLVVFV